jgi:type IV secretion system protein VirB10
MTGPDREDAPPSGRPKAPPPELAARAPRPTAVRLRGGVVKAAVMGAAVLVSGALAWAFIVQPELRASAREEAAETREAAAPRGVRPTEIVTDQPASYDRLPPPRSAALETPAVAEPGTPPTRSTPAGRPRPMRGPTPLTQAVLSNLFFPEPVVPPIHPADAQPSAPATGLSAPVVPQASAAPGYNGHRLTPPLSPYELKGGAMIPAALLTAVDTARPGPVVATVIQNVFDSVSGRHLLLPQGTRLIGSSGGDTRHGDRRAYIRWERLILPNGKSLVLEGAEGVDAQGAVGVRGRVDRRLVPLAVGTAFGGAVTALGQAARDGDRGGGLLGDAGDAAAIEGARIGGGLVERELEVRPSIRLAAGTPVRVMITRDLVLEPYPS